MRLTSFGKPAGADRYTETIKRPAAETDKFDSANTKAVNQSTMKEAISYEKADIKNNAYYYRYYRIRHRFPENQHRFFAARTKGNERQNSDFLQTLRNDDKKPKSMLT